MALTTIPSELSSVSGIADSSDATAITIDSSENVKINQKLSIGTTSTEGALNLNTNTNLTWGTDYSAIGSIKNSQGLLLGNNIKAGASNNTVVRHANGTDAGNFIKLAYNKGVTFHTGIATTLDAEVSEDSNERVRIDTTGNVGIGTTSPGSALHISGDSNLTSQIRFTNTAPTPDNDWTIGSYYNDQGLYFRSNDNATNVMVMLDTGYVGIGEVTPDRLFHVKRSDSGGAVAKFENSAGTVYIELNTANQATGDAGYLSYDSNKKLGFWTDNIQRFTIDEIGSVGIKMTPENAYSAYTSIEFGQEGAIFGNAAGSHVNLAQNVYLDGNGNWKAKNTNASCLLQMVNGEFQLYNGAQVSADAAVSWVQRLTLSTAGALLPGGDGTQNLGSASKRWDNIYVNDMHFSNEGSDGNDVDGTTGNWTLQEGEEYLYVINNKSGKKFKFSLEEVE